MSQFHSEPAAQAAAEEFRRLFAGGGLPDEMPEVRLPQPTMNIVELIMLAALAPSKSESRRLVTQKAVSVGDQTITDVNAQVAMQSGQVLRVGKRRFARIVV